MVIARSVMMALMTGQPEPVEIVGTVVMPLVMVIVGPVEMAKSVEYALVLPPLVVVVMMAGPVEMAESMEYALVLTPLSFLPCSGHVSSS
jgi:hypothetical protein